MKKGQVIKINSGKFLVFADNQTFDCSARGVLKVKSSGVITGDFVLFDEESFSISKILPRKNSFLRPNIANVDAVNIVVAEPPKPDFMMLDKLVLSLVSKGVEVIFSVNKTDLEHTLIDEIISNYKELGCKIFQVSALSGEGIVELKEYLKGKLVAFAGQSAVGKSSLVNAMFGLELKTNDVSEKTQRGRHTTTVAEIYNFDGVRVADTPGFSVIKVDILPEEVGLFYPEYFSRLQDCKYRGCSHISEPGCRVVEDVKNGNLSQDRYNRYKLIFKEILDQYNNKY